MTDLTAGNTSASRWSNAYTIDIASSPDVIWDIFSDVPGWKRWNAGIERIEMRGPFAVGTEFIMVPPGGEVLTSRLIEVRENECFVDETRVGDLVVVVSHRLQRLAADYTRVTYAIEASGTDAEEIGPAIASDFADVLQALKQLVESA